MKRKSVVVFKLNPDNYDLSSLKKADEEELSEQELEVPKKRRVNAKELNVVSRPSPPPEEPEEPVEEVAEESTLISKDLLMLRKTVQLYLDWFPKKLKDFSTVDASSIVTEVEANDILDRMKFQIGASNMAAFNKMFLQNGIELTENVGPLFGLKLQGLSVVTSNNPDIDDVLKEIALDGIQNGWGIQNPYSKLAMILLFEGSKVHNFNMAQDFNSRLKNVVVPDEIVEKYKDI